MKTIVVVALLLVSSMAWGEPMCCNPYTYVCQDCVDCPRTPCPPTIEGYYDLLDDAGNVTGRVFIHSSIEETHILYCEYNGKSNTTRCTESAMRKIETSN